MERLFVQGHLVPPRRRPNPPVVLTNEGNTCYVNVVLQQLRQFRPVVDAIVDFDDDDDDILLELKRFFLAKSGRFSTAGIIDSMNGGCLGCGFRELQRSNDASEFFAALVLLLVTRLGDVFSTLRVRTVCRTKPVGTRARPPVETSNLSLDLAVQAGCKTIEDCLLQHTASEQLLAADGNGFYVHGQKVDAVRNIHVSSCPDTLVINLKRGDQANDWNGIEVTFDETLDLCVALQAKLRPLLSSNFALQGVVIHRTTFADDGGSSKHYYTYSKSNSEWRRLDDLSWSTSTFESVLLDGQGRTHRNVTTLASQLWYTNTAYNATVCGCQSCRLTSGNGKSFRNGKAYSHHVRLERKRRLDALEERKSARANDMGTELEGLPTLHGDFDDEERSLEDRIAEALVSEDVLESNEYFYSLVDLPFDDAVARVERGVDGHAIQVDSNECRVSTPDYLLWSFATQIVDLRTRCPASKSFITQILKIFKAVFGNLFGEELLDLFPTSYKSLLRGFDRTLKKYARVDMCLYGCALFHGCLGDSTKCPKCGSPRMDENSKPLRYFWYCKLGDRLRDIFSVPSLAEQFEFWRHRGQPDDKRESSDHIVDVYDGKLWKEKFQTFANDRLAAGASTVAAISTCMDGMRLTRTGTRSWTPIFHSILNFAPWLRNKRGMLFMAGLISQHPPESDPRWKNVVGGFKPADYNVFLDVIVDELIELQHEGITVYNAHVGAEWKVNAMLLYGLADYRGLQHFTGMSVHPSRCACHHCTDLGYTVAGHTLYPDHFRFLSDVVSPENQERVKSLRSAIVERFGQSALVQDTLELDSPAPHDIDEVKKEGHRIDEMKFAGLPKAAIKRAQQHGGVAFFSALNRLSYFNVTQQIVYCGMHANKNLAEVTYKAMAGHLYSDKNAAVEAAFRRKGFESIYASKIVDLEESSSEEESSSDSSSDSDRDDERLSRSVASAQEETPTNDFRNARRRNINLILPAGDSPSWVMSKESKRAVNRNLQELRLPRKYWNDSTRIFKDREPTVHGLKSHDWMLLLGDIGKCVTRNLMSSETRPAFERLCNVVERLRGRVIARADLALLKEDLHLSLVELSLTMPMLWNRISVHYFHHFGTYIENIGPILTWSMYPVERMGRYSLERMTSGGHQEQQVIGVVEALQANELMRFRNDVSYTIGTYQTRLSSGGQPFMLPLYLTTEVVLRLSQFPKMIPGYSLGLRAKSSIIRLLPQRCKRIASILRRYMCDAIDAFDDFDGGARFDAAMNYQPGRRVSAVQYYKSLLEFEVPVCDIPFQLWMEKCTVELHHRMSVNHVDFRIRQIDQKRASQQCGVLVRSRSESSRADPDAETFEYACRSWKSSALPNAHVKECGNTEGLTLAKRVSRSSGTNSFFFADSIHPTQVAFVPAPGGQSIVFEIV